MVSSLSWPPIVVVGERLHLLEGFFRDSHRKNAINTELGQPRPAFATTYLERT